MLQKVVYSTFHCKKSQDILKGNSPRRVEKCWSQKRISLLCLHGYIQSVKTNYSILKL